ncbi:hypothetical protein G7076_01140 [Sphingomonas sp. HDW15A]|uniref:HdeA family protein n=1 Tax=Sphingomonas sp. HDW15A TaxID=2714942 RepID=UPI00140A8C61|nr:HdeA family protein [Sphingomonas sp. HDW15A]QIK95273.1 hypothetical protein G7076_01140 [Sphingomonas sp. HDW15A]
MTNQFRASAIAAAVAALAFTGPAIGQGPAKADKVDLSTFDCRSLLTMNGEYRDNAVLFLHGYVSGQKKQSVIELGPIAASTDKIIDYCISNPSANALAAFTANR